MEWVLAGLKSAFSMVRCPPEKLRSWTHGKEVAHHDSAPISRTYLCPRNDATGLHLGPGHPAGLLPWNQSVRSARTGSTELARRAGMNAATSATPAKMRGITAKVARSADPIP